MRSDSDIHIQSITLPVIRQLKLPVSHRCDVGIYASDKVKPYLWQTEKTDIHFPAHKIVDVSLPEVRAMRGPGLPQCAAFAVGIAMVKIVTAESRIAFHNNAAGKQCLTVANHSKQLTGAILW